MAGSGVIAGDSLSYWEIRGTWGSVRRRGGEARDPSKVPSLRHEVDCRATPRVEGCSKARDCGWAGGSGRRETGSCPWRTPKLKGSGRGGGSASAWTGSREAQVGTPAGVSGRWREEAFGLDPREGTAHLNRAISAGGCG